MSDAMNNSIFELTLWIYEKKRKRHKDDYQPFSLEKSQVGFFKTAECAEAVIPDWINQAKANRWTENIYCFRLNEYPLGQALFPEKDNLSERIYDQNGNKLDERIYPTVSLTPDWNSVYHGRPVAKIRYKPGDVVEFAGDLFVIECFMTPLAKKTWTSVDETDDGYIALRVDECADEIRFDENGYVILDDQNPQCTDIFPPRFPISPKIQRRIENIRHFVLNRPDND